jgi:hypothetical protein
MDLVQAIGIIITIVTFIIGIATQWEKIANANWGAVFQFLLGLIMAIGGGWFALLPFARVLAGTEVPLSACLGAVALGVAGIGLGLSFIRGSFEDSKTRE